MPLAAPAAESSAPPLRPDGRFFNNAVQVLLREPCDGRFFRSPHRGLKASFAAKQILGDRHAAAALTRLNVVPRAFSVQWLPLESASPSDPYEAAAGVASHRLESGSGSSQAV